MIIDRAFFREAVSITLAVVVVLMALFVLQGAGGVFTRSGEGGGDKSPLVMLIFLYPLMNFGLLLMLGMFIGLLVTLTRWYRDSEIVVLQACGIGTLALLRPVMWFALVFFAVLMAEAMFFRPLVITTIGEIEAASRSSTSTAWISSGTFNDIRGHDGVFYAEKVSSGGEMHNVFLNQPGSETSAERVIVASQAKRFTDSVAGEEFLQFSHGTSYRGQPGRADYELTDFDAYRLRIEQTPVQVRHRDVQALATNELVGNKQLSHQAEWHVRLSKPVAVFVLAALALALSYAEPRRGRYYNLFAAVFLFFVYMQMLLIGETLVRRGEIPAYVGFWWVHILFGLLAAYFLWRRSLGLPLIALPKIPKVQHD